MTTQVWRTFLQHETLTPDQAKQFIKSPRYVYCLIPTIYFIYLKHLYFIQLIIHFYREGEGISRLRRPRFVRQTPEPPAKKDRPDYATEAGLLLSFLSIQLNSQISDMTPTCFRYLVTQNHKQGKRHYFPCEKSFYSVQTKICFPHILSYKSTLFSAILYFRPRVRSCGTRYSKQEVHSGF